MRRPLTLALTLLVAFASLFSLGATSLPFETLKALADRLMPDGEFESLKPGNLIVFRGLLAAAGLFLLALTTLTFLHRWGQVWAFFHLLWADALDSLRSLRPTKSDLFVMALLLLLVAAGIAYRFEYLYSSLHHDEAYTYIAFAKSLQTAATDYHLPNNHVFHSILVYLSTQLFGNAPWAVRLPAFLAGVLLIPAVYALGKCHYDRWGALGAALLVAISPVTVNYSTNARGYTLVALFGLLLLLLAYTVRQGKNRFVWALIVLVSALGMYTVPVFLFPFGIAFLWMLWEEWRAPAPGYASHCDFLTCWLVSGLAAAALTLTLYLPILIYTGPEKFFANSFVAPIPWPDYPETLAHRLTETWAEWTFRVPPLVIILLAAGLTLSLLLHRKISSTRVPLQAAAVIWVTVLLLFQRPNAWSKVWFGLLPLVLLWAAAGLWGALSRLRVRAVPVAALATILLLIPILLRSAVILRELPR
ncbi:MAG: glycosyltransferase family 39 protein, partial [Anaerolineales bacterium]|nr:glycosyltransferase family 39 protein [Anaerolineales bacterium]